MVLLCITQIPNQKLANMNIKAALFVSRRQKIIFTLARLPRLRKINLYQFNYTDKKNH